MLLYTFLGMRFFLCFFLEVKGIYRIIDANINRVSEGLRVVEDIQRFVFNNAEMASKVRTLRHETRKGFCCQELLQFRKATEDVGLRISQNNKLDQKETMKSLLLSNFKRAEEGLRSIEESLKIMGYYTQSKQYEIIRFKVYTLEKDILLKSRYPKTDIYAILGEEFSKGRSNIQVTKELIESGVKIIQYREKCKSKKEIYEECKVIRQLTQENEVTFIVNDHLSIATLVKADGVHIGQDDLPIEEVKRLAGHMIIGLSTHNKQQAKMAVEKGADYIGVGPIFETSTKQNIEASDGLDYLKWVQENIDLPYVAIGGIKESNVLEVKKNGGYCFAMISELIGSSNLAQKIHSIRNLK